MDKAIAAETISKVLYPLRPKVGAGFGGRGLPRRTRLKIGLTVKGAEVSQRKEASKSYPKMMVNTLRKSALMEKSGGSVDFWYS